MTQAIDQMSDEVTVRESGPQEGAWSEARRAATFGLERARLLALATRVLGSRAEAEDVVQDAWFRWRDADAAAVRTPQAWLATVTVRLAIDRLRKLRRDSAAQDGLAGDASWLDALAPSAEETGLRAAHLSQALLMLLDRLGPLEQAVFVLREAFECDYAEIAALTGCTLAHCRQIVHRARGRLAREVSPQAAPADAAQHARTLERLREVLHAQDRLGLMDLLGVTATALAVASAVASDAPRALRAETLALDGEPGVALLAEDGELAAWLHVSESGDQRGFTPVVCVAAAGVVQRANRVFGGAAVRALLAHYSANCGGVNVSMQTTVSPVATSLEPAFAVLA
ncbi:sigma-70 family RNA polymerase sigma factor [Paraburkholderia sp. J67]|uniref:sigma-70 family RNA polymerase sigma factor n=1 Tax=Paraburkholderia sp. J67 TaxID=2805435 RepID=UPI002ABDFF70|nr:sigma-70 family RNA polymerase sigma factor [Paraburkholderia sp. J67]